MDIASVIGYVLGFVCIIGFVLSEGSLSQFFYMPAIAIVFGGVTAACFIKWPLKDVLRLPALVGKVFFFSTPAPDVVIEEIKKLAEVARRESVFALEKIQITDPFMKKAMTLAADNRPPAVIQTILGWEVEAMQERHVRGSDMTENMAADAPGFGMLGTLLGLVLMLSHLEDPSNIGPSMATALLTTTYGAFIANLIMLPMTNKLKIRSKEEALNMNIVIAGTIGIVSGENPRLIVEKLNAFLPPSARKIDADEGDKGSSAKKA